MGMIMGKWQVEQEFEELIATYTERSTPGLIDFKVNLLQKRTWDREIMENVRAILAR